MRGYKLGTFPAAMALLQDFRGFAKVDCMKGKDGGLQWLAASPIHSFCSAKDITDAVAVAKAAW